MMQLLKSAASSKSAQRVYLMSDSMSVKGCGAVTPSLTLARPVLTVHQHVEMAGYIYTSFIVVLFNDGFLFVHQHVEMARYIYTSFIVVLFNDGFLFSFFHSP